MGFLKRTRAAWKAASTKDKIELILSLACDGAMWMVSHDLSKKLGKDHGVFGKALINLGMSGLGIAAGEVAGKALTESYGVMLADTIDKAKAKARENQPDEKMKEDEPNEEASGNK